MTLRKTSLALLLAAALPLALGTGSCHSVEEWDNDLYGNFDALWTVLDEHYCFFAYKDVDWNETRLQYRSRIRPDMELQEFFDLCADMLAVLRDGHTNLSSWFDVSYYRKWGTDYPQNFDLRLVQEHYLHFDYRSGSGMIYRMLEESNVGYVYYSSFAAGISDSFVDNMLLSMREADGLIIDVRDNSGGDLTNVEKLVSRFIDQRICAGYISHKTGPGHDDFSEPYAYFYDPAMNHVRWLKPVVVLANRSTYSAANNFVSVMKALPNVTVAGDVTGGGSGMPYTSEIPCGWGVRFSAVPIYDSEMRLTEFGVEPSPGCRTDMDPQAALQGRDTMLDFAIAFINNQAEAGSRQ
ncbi:MAG: S41 family peptidase [Muribaculaceae bacterium]|nr:S41 family peptidase [Muribaculaceae bacterium]